MPRDWTIEREERPRLLLYMTVRVLYELWSGDLRLKLLTANDKTAGGPQLVRRISQAGRTDKPAVSVPRIVP